MKEMSFIIHNRDTKDVLIRVVLGSSKPTIQIKRRYKMTQLVLEAKCIYQFFRNEENILPACCILGVGNISFNCLNYEEKIKFCPYFTYGKVRSTILLTDKEGNTINANSFWADLNLSDKEWEIKESDWIEKYDIFINKLNDN